MEILFVLIAIVAIAIIAHSANSARNNSFQEKRDFSESRSTAISNYYRNEYALIDEAIHKAYEELSLNGYSDRSLLDKILELREKISRSEELNWDNFSTASPPTTSYVKRQLGHLILMHTEPVNSHPDSPKYKEWAKKYKEFRDTEEVEIQSMFKELEQS